MTLLIPATGLPAEEVWLELCAAEGPPAIQQRQYLAADGSSRWLRISQRPTSGCTSRRLSIDGANVRWFGQIPEDKAEALSGGVVLQGLLNDDLAAVSEVEVERPTDGVRAPFPLASDLLARLHPTIYGVEERASLSLTDAALTLRCEVGERPAGLVLRNDGARLPAAVNARLALDYQAEAQFLVGYADGLDHPLAEPHLLGPLAMESSQSTFPLPDDLASQTSAAVDATFAVTLQCPQAGGVLRLDQLILMPGLRRQTPPRSIWIWRPSEWLTDADDLLTELQTLATPIAYISVPILNGRVTDPDRLSAFIQRANEQGIQIWAVEGDPHAVLPNGQADFLRRARALARYNDTQPAVARLHGVQYDIEPYLLPDFALNTDDWLEAYVETIALLDDALTVPLEIAVPFWWSSLSVNDRSLLDALAPHIQSLNVMNYRTEPDQLQQFAEPFLAWGAARGVDVRIALEAGPILDEQRWHYRPARDAEAALWHLQLGDEHLLVLLDRPGVVPAAAGYQRMRTSTFHGDRLTFQDERVRMEQVMRFIEPLWSAWPSFAGLALHEYRLPVPSSADSE